MFTARYGLSPYVTQIRFVFKGLTSLDATEEAHLTPVDSTRWLKVHVTGTARATNTHHRYSTAIYFS